jgi:hypothetical protein
MSCVTGHHLEGNPPDEGRWEGSAGRQGQQGEVPLHPEAGYRCIGLLGVVNNGQSTSV